MELRYSETAVKASGHLSKARRTRLYDTLEAIAVQPFAHHANVTALKGEKDLFRLRLGDWRAVYKIDRAAGTMTVIAIEPRGSAYR